MEKEQSYFGEIGHGLKTLAVGMKTSWKEYWKDFFTNKSTEQYPENRKTTLHVAKRHRGRLVFKRDENGAYKCTACTLCEKACPNGTIKILSDLNKEQKLRLLIDRRYLAKTSEVSSVSLFKLLEAFKNETDAVIWDMLSVIVNDLKIFFDPYTEEKRAFQRRVGEMARGQFERLGVAAKDDDSDNDRRLRATIMGLMRFSKDEGFKKQIEDTYAKQDITKVDTDLRWVVAAALLRENNSLSSQYFNIYCSTVDAALKRDIGGALAASRDRDTLKGYLPKLMDGTIRPQDRFGFYYRLVGNYVSQDDALDWMFENWDWLAKEEGDKTIADYPRYVATIIRQEEAAKKYREFFEPKINHPALSRDIKVGLADIDAKLKLIHEDQSAVFKELGF